MPQSVTVKGSPEVYVPSGGTVFELDFLDDVASDFEDTFSGVDAGQGPLTAEEKPEGEEGYGPGDNFTVQVKLVVDTPTFDTPEELSGYSVSIEEETGTINLSDAFGPIPPHRVGPACPRRSVVCP